MKRLITEETRPDAGLLQRIATVPLPSSDRTLTQEMEDPPFAMILVQVVAKSTYI